MVFRGNYSLDLSYLQLVLTRYNCCSVVKSCPTLCDPRDCSMPGFPVPQHLRDKFLQAKLGVRAARCVPFFWLVGANRKGGGPETVMCSVWFPFSIQVGALASTELKRYMAVYIPWEGTRTHPSLLCNNFLRAPPLSLHALTSLMSNPLKLPFGTRESLGGWMKLISYK